jgi:glycosyltransferase involved in cell wall biosynthesis
MRIAQIAPLIESVPPRTYGGTERVVSYLTEELVARGHDVTLFASGDSRTRARLVECAPVGLRFDETCESPTIHHVLELERFLARAHEFDAAHFHLDALHLPACRRLGLPYVTTLHGRLDLPDLVPLFREFDDAPFVSISNAQRRPHPAANWVATVHHGLPPDLYRCGRGGGGYLAFLGRVSREKRPDRAIAIAHAAGLPLRIAAKIDRADQEYFEREVAHLLTDRNVEFVGEIGDADKDDFLGNAEALLFPIDWPEPFGLIVIEAFACGTPVIAWPHGSVPELVDPGVTGFVVDDPKAAAAAVQAARRLDRGRIRAIFERRFSVARMAADYEVVYETLCGARRSASGVGGAAIGVAP